MKNNKIKYLKMRTTKPNELTYKKKEKNQKKEREKAAII